MTAMKTRHAAALALFAAMRLSEQDVGAQRVKALGFLRTGERAMLALGLLALAITSGCFAAAVPVASGILRAAASGISSSARAAKNNQVAQDTESCDMGERALPRLIELRTDNLGMTMYRPLKLGGPV